MSGVIATGNQVPEQELPWYRYGWPWFLISIPVISIVLGSVMLYLALQANNSLVVDDYYKEGKAYNLIIERDRLASLLGLSADVTQGSEGVIVELNQQTPVNLPEALVSDAQLATSGFVLPDSLTLRWVHVTQAELDGVATLLSIGGARYIAQNTTLPAVGKFRLHIEPTTSGQPADQIDDASQSADAMQSNWRLTSSLTSLGAETATRIDAPLVEQVFNRDVLQ